MASVPVEVLHKGVLTISEAKSVLCFQQRPVICRDLAVTRTRR